RLGPLVLVRRLRSHGRRRAARPRGILRPRLPVKAHGQRDQIPRGLFRPLARGPVDRPAHAGPIDGVRFHSVPHHRRGSTTRTDRARPFAPPCFTGAPDIPSPPRSGLSPAPPHTPPPAACEKP